MNSDKPLSLDQIRPVLRTIHRAADLLDTDQTAAGFLGRPTGRFNATQRTALRALSWVSQALDPDATPADRVAAKRALRGLLNIWERMWNTAESPMTTKDPNQELRL